MQVKWTVGTQSGGKRGDEYEVPAREMNVYEDEEYEAPTDRGGRKGKEEEVDPLPARNQSDTRHCTVHVSLCTEL